MKSEQDVVNDFNEIVNMTSEELDEYLKTEGSETTGFQKEDGSGESIGHESGRKIVDILKRNPDKDPSKYTDEDKEHMRRVVSYCKRHLAQEGKLKATKTPEELEQTKSTRSLKNWGHDPMKTLPKSEQPKKSEKPASKKADKPVSKKSEKPVSKKSTTADKPKSKAKANEDKIDEEKEEEPEQKEQDAEKQVEKDSGDQSEKPKSKGRGKPKTSESPKKTTTEVPPETVDSSKNDKEVVDDKQNGNGNGEKRGRGRPPNSKKDGQEDSEKPVSKKAKTTKEPTEGTRKPPSRGVKKA